MRFHPQEVKQGARFARLLLPAEEVPRETRGESAVLVLLGCHTMVGRLTRAE